MTTLTVTVTKEILEKSKNCGENHFEYVGFNCAISLAIADIFPSAYVYRYGLTVKGFDAHRVMNNDYDILLPIKATKFIERFDKKKPAQRVSMKPISFNIDIPDSVIETIDIDEIRPLLYNHPTLKLSDPKETVIIGEGAESEDELIPAIINNQ